MTYKVKRMTKILIVCAGIVVVSVSLGLIAALELVASYHKDPATAKTFSEGLDPYFNDRRHRRVYGRCLES
jgi:hypothetical protein